jgi:ubiquinone/menaquinone biosynthesis C-methylase UbiE
MADAKVPVDPFEVKRQITEGWDALAEKWDRMAPMVDRWFQPVTAALIESLRLKPGDRVLELAAGSGGLTLHLARVVGTDGRVLATDSGSNMVKLAARNALAAGLSNVTARVMDGETPDLTWASMDAVVCRQGFMFFPDPAGALERLLRVLRPGGRISLSVFSTPDRNGFMTVPVSILSRWSDAGKAKGPVPLPAEPSSGPGPFSLAEPGLLGSMMQRAGFVDVQTRAVPTPLRLPTAADYVQFSQTIFGSIVEDLPPESQRGAWAEVAEVASSFAQPDWEGARCELLVVSGGRPGGHPASH